MTVPTYGAECPYCAQVRHVADQAEAVDALARHILAGTDEMCAAWPDFHWRRLNARHTRRAKLRRGVLEAEGPNLAYCGWYLRQLGIPGHETCTCSFGCWEEPACMKLGAPHPDAYYIALGERDYQPVALQRSTTR